MTECECGCGQPAPIAKTNDKSQGLIKGQPKRFIHGHHTHKPVPPADFSTFYIPVTESGCWLWTGYVMANGYARYWRADGSTMAHRYAYQLHKGPIPEGLQLDHLCRVRCCVNPDHLEAVTIKTNVLRGIGITANNAKLTHCKHGHPLIPENIYQYHDNGRRCRICRANRRKPASLERQMLEVKS